MKGQKFKTVVVYPFSVPEYRSNYVFVDRIGIRDEIRQGREAKRLSLFYRQQAKTMTDRMRKWDDIIKNTESFALRTHYECIRFSVCNQWHNMMEHANRESQIAVDHGHKANALKNPIRPRPTHGEWVRAHDAARLSRRPYRRSARVNQRVAAFNYEDAAEHDVVDLSQLKWTQLAIIMAIHLHHYARQCVYFKPTKWINRWLGSMVKTCERCGYESHRSHFSGNVCYDCVSTDYYHVHDDTHFF